MTLPVPAALTRATLAIFACLLAGTSTAEEASPIPRGTAGLIALPFEALNAGPGTIACGVALAHWYSVDLGEAAPGAAVRAALWIDPRTGGTVLLNAGQDQMPVQALWCGIAGRAWTTRSLLPLRPETSAKPPSLRLTCAPEGERLVCR